MENERVYCPHCGEWNGHPDGVVMREDGNGIANPQQFGYPEQFWYYCPVCGSETPCEKSREAARAAALRRYTPPQKPLTYEQVKERAAENAPVYCVPGVGNGGWMIVTHREQCTEDGYSYPGGVDFDAEDIFGNVLDGDFYGLRELNGLPHCLGWIAFDHKPTDQEIKAADWRINNG